MMRLRAIMTVLRGRTRRWRLFVLAVPIAVVALAFVVVSALAVTGAPPLIEKILVTKVWADRAQIEAQGNFGRGSGFEKITGRWELATSKQGPWTVINRGFTTADTSLAAPNHLAASETYYARVTIENESGQTVGETQFTTTPVGRPEFLLYSSYKEYPPAGCPSRALEKESGSPTEEKPFIICGGEKPPTPTSAEFDARVETDGAETRYRFEYSTEENGVYAPVPGASGSISVAEESKTIVAHLENLTPETTYYLRGIIENEKGTTTDSGASFETHTARPQIGDVYFSSVTPTSVHVEGGVFPNGFETHWRFEYSSSQAGPWTAGPEGTIPQSEADYSETSKRVAGDLAGLKASTGYFVRLFVENAYGSETVRPRSFETEGAPVVATFAAHAIHGELVRVLGSVRPHGLDTHYHFLYVSQEKFAQGEWAEAQSTPEEDAGSGELVDEVGSRYEYPTSIVAQDLQGLRPGETYHYRIVAANSAPENPVVYGEGQTLTVPSVSQETSQAACPNESLRASLSGHLVDCRAYEQVTPVEKHGAQELNTYAPLLERGALVGEDGEHLTLEAPYVMWGSGVEPSSGGSPYFFSRTSAGWQMTAGTVQPEAGLSSYKGEMYSPDLNEVGLEAGWGLEGFGLESKHLEFKVGRPGGPYSTVATVPRLGGESLADYEGWVAASEDFGKMILTTRYRNVIEGQKSATKTGYDLYEYADDKLQQLNVSGPAPGVTIGSCGAAMARGVESVGDSPNTPTISSRHAVSTNGSRVFFEAVPGSDCSEARHLYMRVDGSETVDLGSYTFLAANAQGSQLLLRKRTSGVSDYESTFDYVLYDVQARSATLLFSAHEIKGVSRVSQDFSALYFGALDRLTPDAPPLESESPARFKPENIYRYDLAKHTLGFVAQASHTDTDKLPMFASPDGRYLYFRSGDVAGIPGGAPSATGNNRFQVYRFDSATDTIECISCASPFDPEPKLNAAYAGEEGDGSGVVDSRSGIPAVMTASADGGYVFFQTASALVPRDVDGESAPGTGPGGAEESRPLANYESVSSDVYEWRAPGVSGCDRVQGCVSLVSSGTGGFLVTLLGTTASGRDVFFETGSSLLPSDNDTALDIYDARVGGGFAEAVRPVECEGDTCSTPATAPIDATPSSLTFNGPENILQPTPQRAAVKSKKHRSKHRKRKARRSSRKRSDGSASVKRSGKGGQR